MIKVIYEKIADYIRWHFYYKWLFYRLNEEIRAFDQVRISKKKSQQLREESARASKDSTK